MQIWHCHEKESWSPCRGGDDAGYDGDGFCEKGYHGPRCELCDDVDGVRYYFDTLDATCRDCADLTSRTTVAVLSLLLFIFASGGGCLVIARRLSICRSAVKFVTKKVRTVRKMWKRAGLRYKTKAMVGLFQCVSAVPSVFNVTTPAGLEEYAFWINLMERMAEYGLQFMIPPACFGPYSRFAALKACRLPSFLQHTCLPSFSFLVPAGACGLGHAGPFFSC
jgi:hypothetical protein